MLNKIGSAFLTIIAFKIAETIVDTATNAAATIILNLKEKNDDAEKKHAS